ncbi:MAG: putative pantothenate kinase, (phosphoribulokinase/uridine kinase family protein) [Planctomycetaceae bacterium]|nr:putative pantothenate kinase, (phosphoribulokinase/uridine kinase family protein) [Planctomycetaceae bacterium]
MALADSNSPSGPVAAAIHRAEVILEALRKRPETYLIGIAGIPGSGKTTLCEVLKDRMPDAVVIPMDGYHLPRSVLDAEGLRRRGAPYTFDAAACRTDMARLAQTRSGSFPTFDHAEKDPRPDMIQVTPSVPLIIVEGIYVLMHDWGLESLFDLRVFLDCDLDVAVERLTLRHVACGISQNEADARHRALTNDRLNSIAILNDGCRERADLVLPG